MEALGCGSSVDGGTRTADTRRRSCRAAAAEAAVERVREGLEVARGALDGWPPRMAEVRAEVVRQRAACRAAVESAFDAVLAELQRREEEGEDGWMRSMGRSRGGVAGGGRGTRRRRRRTRSRRRRRSRGRRRHDGE